MRYRAKKKAPLEGAARERCLWQKKRPQQLGRHLRLRKQSAAQMLSANPEAGAEGD